MQSDNKQRIIDATKAISDNGLMILADALLTCERTNEHGQSIVDCLLTSIADTIRNRADVARWEMESKQRKMERLTGFLKANNETPTKGKAVRVAPCPAMNTAQAKAVQSAYDAAKSDFADEPLDLEG